MTDIIYKFSASWCNPCKQLSKTLEGADLGCEVVEIDIDSNIELCEKYNIRGVPTLVFLGSDNYLIGNSSIPKIKEWIAECRSQFN